MSEKPATRLAPETITAEETGEATEKPPLDPRGIRVVMVDDHKMFLSGVKAEIGDRVNIVGIADTVETAIKVINETDPDVVLLDVHMPNGGGLAVISAFDKSETDVHFLALSVSDAAEDVIAIVRAGARGYLTKTVGADGLVSGIARVHSGDAVFSPRLAGFVLDAFSGAPPATATADESELEVLTPREQEVLRLIARGYAYKQVARRLHISIKTVESHVSSVLRKLQLSSRYELTRWATDRKLL